MNMEQFDLFDACRKGDVDTIWKLYNEDPQIINIVDMRGFTPLIIAVYNNQPAAVEFLLSKSADIASQDGSGNTALMGACFRGYRDIVARLLDAGAEVNQRNFQGATALTFAATFGQLEIARMLLNSGADINVRDVRGKSSLDHAVIQENLPMIELLEEYRDTRDTE